jgi:hypothetical protein
MAGYSSGRYGATRYGRGGVEEDVEVLGSSQPAFINCPTPISVEQPCYIVSSTNVSKTKGAYVKGHGENSSSQSAYIVNRIAEGSQACYLVAVPISASIQSVFINGLESLFSSKRAMVVNTGLIGDWHLDDGKVDNFASVAKDYSDIANNGAYHNFPDWVDGPRGEC